MTRTKRIIRGIKGTHVVICRRIQGSHASPDESWPTYTELFFSTNEAVALAAGHSTCGDMPEGRRRLSTEEYRAFMRRV